MHWMEWLANGGDRFESKKVDGIGDAYSSSADSFCCGTPNTKPFSNPGVKLGLANIITVYAVYHYRVREVFLLVVARILLGSFFGGGMMTLMYSMAGGLFCLVGMLLLKRFLSEKYIWICSVLGAIFHNIGQMTVACMVAGWGILFYLPFLLISGCLAGGFTGVCAQLILRRTSLEKQTRHLD